MRMFMMGDLHGNATGEFKFLNVKNFPEQRELTKKDFLFQVGDFGAFWYYKEVKHKIKEDIHYRDYLADKNFTTIIIPGNHENYDEIESLSTEYKWGGELFVYYSKAGNPLYIAKRGEVYTINNKKILTIGGAKSGDINNRKSYQDYINGKCKLYQVSYWEREMISEEDIDNMYYNLNKYNFKIDYVFSHTAPTFMLEEFLRKSFGTIAKFTDPNVEILNDVENLLEYKFWGFGHIHSNGIKKFKNYTFATHYKKEPLEI